MNIYFTLIVLFLLSAVHSFSRDLIVVAPGDSIKINISPKDVELSSDTLNTKEFLPQWRFGFYGGPAYRLNRSQLGINRAELSYHKKLKSGISFGVDANYFFRKKIGVGFRYDAYFSNGTRDEKNKDKIRISFVGSGLVYRAPFKNEKTTLLTGFWLGYQPFKNNSLVDGVDTKLSANTMAWGVSVGLEHRLGEKCAISLSGQCFLSSSYKLKKEAGNGTEIITFPSGRFEDLSRASLTLGLKFN